MTIIEYYTFQLCKADNTVKVQSDITMMKLVILILFAVCITGLHHRIGTGDRLHRRLHGRPEPAVEREDNLGDVESVTENVYVSRRDHIVE